MVCDDASNKFNVYTLAVTTQVNDERKREEEEVNEANKKKIPLIMAYKRFEWTEETSVPNRTHILWVECKWLLVQSYNIVRALFGYHSEKEKSEINEN